MPWPWVGNQNAGVLELESIEALVSSCTRSFLYLGRNPGADLGFLLLDVCIGAVRGQARTTRRNGRPPRGRSGRRARRLSFAATPLQNVTARTLTSRPSRRIHVLVGESRAVTLQEPFDPPRRTAARSGAQCSTGCKTPGRTEGELRQRRVIQVAQRCHARNP